MTTLIEKPATHSSALLELRQCVDDIVSRVLTGAGACGMNDVPHSR